MFYRAGSFDMSQSWRLGRQLSYLLACDLENLDNGLALATFS